MTKLLDAAQTPDQENVDYMAYVTEKFKKADGTLDVEALAKGKYYSDTTVTQRDFTIDQMRETINSQTSLEKVLEQIKAMNTTPTPNTPVTPSGEQVANSEMKPEELKGLVAREFQHLQTQAQQDANVAMVREELKKAWGPGYVTQLKSVGAELGLSEHQLEQMAAQTPKALLALAKPSKAADVSPPRSSYNSAANAPNTVDRTPLEKHYDNMLKNDPNTYFTPKVQMELFNLVKAGTYRIKE